MLTFISGWKSADRDKALLNQRDPLRRAIFFLENSTSFLDLLPNGADAQIIVTFDALDRLYRLFPALRASGALLAANERLEAFPGDRVLFTRGGSFRWPDHLLESQTSLLTSEEVLDAGIVPDDES